MHPNLPTLTEAFEAAMVDAMNRYVREVLARRGLISQESFDHTGDPEVLEAKYAIAREWGAKWAAMFEDPNWQPEPP